jgi:hypothetical protein
MGRLPPLLILPLARLLRLTMTLTIVARTRTWERCARPARVRRKPIILDRRKGKERVHVIRIHEQVESRWLIRLLLYQLIPSVMGK